jgi:2-iminobutanoate/2-iminopropanoate deaminase
MGLPDDDRTGARTCNARLRSRRAGTDDAGETGTGRSPVPAADVSSGGTRRDEDMARRSIEVPGLRHGAPIPQASVVGNLLVSGGINPVDPQTGAIPDSTDEQVAMAFANVRRVLAAAGGTAQDIVKCTVFVQDKAIRPVIDKYWVEMFPDETSRPARHTLRTDLQDGTHLQLEIMAVLGQG